MYNTELLNELYLKHKSEVSKEQLGYKINYYYGKNNLVKEHFVINTKTGKLLNRDAGSYTIITYPDILECTISQTHYLINHLAKIFKTYLGEINTNSNILIAALGNRHIKADSLGTSTIKNIIVTRTFNKLQFPGVSAISAGVLGLTGIESGDVIEAICNKTNPDIVILIDTLCALSYKRLGCSFQINNAGIIPGAGINNTRKAINKNTLNRKIIIIGVPLVVYAKSFIDDAIGGINVNQILSNNKEIKLIEQQFLDSYNLTLNNLSFENLVLTLKDIEQVVSRCGEIIACSINKAILNLSPQEQKELLNKL